MRLNEAEKEAPPLSADAQPPAARSTRLAQEPAAEKRSYGRPRPGWVGPRWKTKNDGQPENHNHKRYCARRMSWHPKKSGKKKARGKKTVPNCLFTETHPGRRRAGPPDDDGGILAKCRPCVSVSGPNFARKYALCSKFQNLQDNRAAKPETTMQQKWQKIQN